MQGPRRSGLSQARNPVMGLVGRDRHPGQGVGLETRLDQRHGLERVIDGRHEHILVLVTLPHVSCKISGVLAYCAPDAAAIDAIRPYVEHIVSTFPSDRLVCGSDWPVVNMASDMPRRIDIFNELVGGLSDDEAKAIGHRNAERIYGVGG